nr:monovalent cation/H(+) antiporter subunit G [Corynebacterium lactis]
MILIADIIAIGAVVSGALLCLAAAIGLARFRDTVSRMHASSKPQTLGLMLTLTGALLHVLVHGTRDTTTLGDLGLLTLIICFALGTAPIIGNRVGHEAYKEGLIDDANLARDDSSGCRG